MKIAIPINEKNIDSKICNFFGRALYFLIFNSENKEIGILKNPGKDSQGGSGIKAVQQIIDNNIDIVIALQLGNNAIEVLREANIKIYKGIEDSVKENIHKFLNNELENLK